MSNNSFAGINFNNNDSKNIFEYQKKAVCNKYKDIDDLDFKINIHNDINRFSYIIKGNIGDNLKDISLVKTLYIKYNASSPPTYNNSYSGSALPFPNENIAFENTPNKGVAKVINGSFEFTIKYPNSYYTNLGNDLVSPEVKIIIVNNDNNKVSDMKIFKLGNSVPFRTLTWPVERNWNKGALFYDNKNLPIRTQYEILLDSAYPSENKVPVNFWGTIKPH